MGVENTILNYDEYFMSLAMLVSKRSKDPKRQVGAVIVNSDDKIVSTGYNGFPNNCKDTEFPWTKEPALDPDFDKSYYVVHAELNAILNATALPLKDCIMYVTYFPCNECVKAIIQSGIKRIIYLDPPKDINLPSSIAAVRMLKAANIEFEKIEMN